MAAGDINPATGKPYTIFDSEWWAPTNATKAAPAGTSASAGRGAAAATITSPASSDSAGTTAAAPKPASAAPAAPATTQPAPTPAAAPAASSTGYTGINPSDISKYADVFAKYRDDAMAAGRARGDELFGNGTLSRLDEGRSADMSDVIKRYQAGLGGYTGDELQGMRDQAGTAINGQAQTNLRQLRGVQGAAGVHGGLAAAQQATALNEAAKQRAQFEQNLFVKNADEQQNRLGQYNTALTGAEATELGKQKFNIGQGEKEKYGQLATEMGYGSLGAGDTGLATQLLLGDAMAKSGASMGGKKGGASGGGLSGITSGVTNGGQTLGNTVGGGVGDTIGDVYGYAKDNPWIYLIPGIGPLLAGGGQLGNIAGAVTS